MNARIPTAENPCRYPAPDCGCEYCEQQAEMARDKRHSDGGTCCECGAAHECEDCPVFA